MRLLLRPCRLVSLSKLGFIGGMNDHIEKAKPILRRPSNELRVHSADVKVGIDLFHIRIVVH